MKYVWVFAPNEHRLEKYMVLFSNYGITAHGSTEIETHEYEEMRNWAPEIAVIDMLERPAKGKRLYHWFRHRIHTRDVPILLIGCTDKEFIEEAIKKERFVQSAKFDEIISIYRKITEM